MPNTKELQDMILIHSFPVGARARHLRATSSTELSCGFGIFQFPIQIFPQELADFSVLEAQPWLDIVVSETAISGQSML